MSQKVALVTGSTRGIGKAVAIELAREDINVVINGRHPGQSAKETVDICRKEGVETYFFTADISNGKDRESLIEKIKAVFGRLDILINNAGIASEERKDMLQMSEESFDRVLGTNLKGTFFLTQLVAPWMIEQKKQNLSRSCVLPDHLLDVV